MTAASTVVPHDVPGSVRYRIGQAWAHVMAFRQKPAIPDDLAPLVREGIVAEAVGRLSPADRSHLISVARQLADAGWSRDVVTAGLLHDIGKAGGIGVVHRGAWVILRVALPCLTMRLAGRETAPPGCTSLWLLATHARRGAILLREGGYDGRVCWLVEHHDRTDPDDPGLRALIAADNGQPVPRPGCGS